MTRRSLEAALQQRKPFTMKLADGSTHHVPHLDHVFLPPPRAGEIVLWEDDGTFHIISLLTITKLTFGKPSRTAKAG